MGHDRRLVIALAISWALAFGLSARADEVDWSEYMEPSTPRREARPEDNGGARQADARRPKRSRVKRTHAKRAKAKAAKRRAARTSHRR